MDDFQPIPRPLKNPNQPGRRGKLTPAQRKDVLTRYQAGEKMTPLAVEYGVSRQAIDQLVKFHLFPESRVRKKALRSRLLADERKKLVEILRTSLPRDHKLHKEGHGHPDFWNTDRVLALGKRLFDKKLYAYTIRECIQEARPDPRFDPDAKPEPPRPPDIRDLDPELAEDKDYVKYYFSPICQQIRQKEYEWALREWEERQARRAQGEALDPHKRKRGRPRKNPEPTEIVGDDDDGPIPFDGSTPFPGSDTLMPAYHNPPAPGQRRGKHAKSKGAPFTKPKRKKKR